MKLLVPTTNLQEIQRTEKHVTSWGYSQQNPNKKLHRENNPFTSGNKLPEGKKRWKENL